MLPELGNFALILALLIAFLQATLPLYGAHKHIPAWISLAKPAAHAQMVLLLTAFICLMYAFINGDFSVAYVAHHSNSQLPLVYRIAGVWGGHEGSLLLWSLILSIWGSAVARFTPQMPDVFIARVLAVMAMIGIGFLLLLLLTSNPFARLFPVPVDGNDLNPLLQDIGLVIHPPVLYIGYVGFSVSFSFAIAALISGRLDAAWARWSLPWTNVAWVFLTVGIVGGSWWAYYELGWGGWWFWDPVENASFMPWLAGTALIHSLVATEKRGVFKAWTVLLAVITFSLSLLGAFLVRSGILTSVHAFATDPARGLFILIFLSIVIGGSLALYAWRAPAIISHVRFASISRETAILVNNVLLSALCFIVLLGTLYPLILDVINGTKISVGAPYFNFLFAVIGTPLAIFLGIGAWLRWKTDDFRRFNWQLLAPAITSLVIGFAVPFLLSPYSWYAMLGISLGGWVILSSLAMLGARTRRGTRIYDFLHAPRAVYGMTLAHIGVGVLIIGVVSTTVYGIEKDVRMVRGESYAVAGYTFLFTGVKNHRGINYDAIRGEFLIQKNGKTIHLYPEKRTYGMQQNPMTEAAIDAGFTRDLYVALGEPLDETTNGEGAWSVRIYYKPFIRWIWAGALLMALGGLLAAFDRRYRRRRISESG